jgi:3-methyl-2-oxobutanoate hydroxymethyltransferase
MARLTVQDLQKMKDRGEIIAMSIVYDYTTARIADEAGTDCILVGDSLARSVLGYDANANTTMDEMILFARAAVRGSERAVVFADMPFMSYQMSIENALYNAGRFIREAGVQALKLEGNSEICDAVRAITRAGIPVQGHMGFTPMTSMAIGGFNSADAVKPEERIRQDAFNLQDAGCASIMFTAVPPNVATELTNELRVPTFAGGGAGNGCDAFLVPVGLNAALAQKGPDKWGQTPAGAMYERMRKYIEDLKKGNRPTRD